MKHFFNTFNHDIQFYYRNVIINRLLKGWRCATGRHLFLILTFFPFIAHQKWRRNAYVHDRLVGLEQLENFIPQILENLNLASETGQESKHSTRSSTQKVGRPIYVPHKNKLYIKNHLRFPPYFHIFDKKFPSKPL